MGRDKFSDCGATDEEVVESLQEELDYMQRTARSYAARCRELEARNEHLVKIFSSIMLCMAAPPVKLEDGRTMQFVDPDPARTLKLLQKSIQQAIDAVTQASGEVKS
jgi:hypothetical protein